MIGARAVFWLCYAVCEFPFTSKNGNSQRAFSSYSFHFLRTCCAFCGACAAAILSAATAGGICGAALPPDVSALNFVKYVNKVRFFTMPFKHANWYTMPSMYTPYAAPYPSITMHYTHTSQLLHTACALYAVCILAWLPCAVLVVLVAFLPWQALGYLLRLYIARIPHMLRHTVY